MTGREQRFGFQQIVFLSALLRFSDKALDVPQSRLKTKPGDTLEDYLKDIPQFGLSLKLKEKNPKEGLLEIYVRRRRLNGSGGLIVSGLKNA